MFPKIGPVDLDWMLSPYVGLMFPKIGPVDLDWMLSPYVGLMFPKIGPVDLDWMLSPYVGLAYIVPGNLEPVGSIQIDKSKVCDAIGTSHTIIGGAAL